MRLLRRPFEPTPDAALVAALGLNAEDLGAYDDSYGLAEAG
jgi:hypothetical protein